MADKYVLISLLLLLTSCGASPTKKVCDGNVEVSGFILDVQLVSADNADAIYQFTICENSNARGAVLSIYGGDSQTEIDEIFGASNSILQSRAADPSILDESEAGSTFEITLPADNLYFVIYEAELDGPTFVLGNTTKIIEGDLIQ